MSHLNHAALSQAATEARGLAIDAVHKCSSGHLGLPLGAAEIGAVLFGSDLRYHPGQPKWLNRDRFVLSAGHGSMFLYGWLHLAGYDLPLEEVKNFRQLHSKTPGHPEFAETVGVEATTGPLGQGVGNAVGYALSAKMAAAKFNTADHVIFDQTIVCLAGDGCLQEGVASEAIAFAGHVGLDNLVLIYDSNDVTLDAMAEVTQSYDACKRFEAFGWDAVQVDGHDLDALHAAITAAKANRNGKPKLIEAKTIIGKGIPQVAGTAAGHGEGGAKFSDEARKGLGLPDEHFYVSEGTRAYFTAHTAALAAAYGLVRGRFRGRDAIQTLLLAPLVVPSLVIGLAILLAFSGMGVRAVGARLVGAHVLITFPYMVRTILASLARLDPAVEEAARTLGASALRCFVLVTLPLVRPGVVAGMLFAFIVSFDNVSLSLFLTNARTNTLPIAILNYVEYNFDPSVAAISTMLVAFSLGAALLVERLVGLRRVVGG